jgi:hypothetical protein
LAGIERVFSGCPTYKTEKPVTKKPLETLPTLKSLPEGLTQGLDLLTISHLDPLGTGGHHGLQLFGAHYAAQATSGSQTTSIIANPRNEAQLLSGVPNTGYVCAISVLRFELLFRFDGINPPKR